MGKTRKWNNRQDHKKRDNRNESRKHKRENLKWKEMSEEKITPETELVLKLKIK